MEGGVIGVIEGELENVSSFHDTIEQDDDEFIYSFQIRGTSYTDSGQEVLTGHAATQEVEEETRIRIEPSTGEIVVQEEPIKSEKYTNFVCVPDKFVAVDGGPGTFLFEYLSHEHNSVNIERAEIDLNNYAERYYTADGVDPWQVGFYGNIGNAEKGVVYGEEVFSDDEIGEILERSQLNQLGLQYEEDGHIVKNTLSESGYVELYQPSSYDSTDFAGYIIQDIMEFIE